MPSSMIHLLTGYMFTSMSNRVKNKSQFYLGCIAPDAVNADFFADKPIRYSAHLRDENLDQWAQNAIDFYTDNLDKNIYDNDFLLGFTLHIYTDIAWDKRYNKPFLENLGQCNLSPLEFSDAKWDEFFNFDQTQFEAAWWRDFVKPALKSAKAFEINHVPKEQIESFVCRKENEENEAKTNYPPRVLTQKTIDEFVLYAVALLKNDL